MWPEGDVQRSAKMTHWSPNERKWREGGRNKTIQTTLPLLEYVPFERRKAKQFDARTAIPAHTNAYSLKQRLSFLTACHTVNKLK